MSLSEMLTPYTEESQYTTEGANIQTFKTYFGEFRKEFTKELGVAKKAMKTGDEAAFYRATKRAKEVCHDTMDKIEDIKENGLLNIVLPLLLSEYILVAKILTRILPGLNQEFDYGGDKKKNIGNFSKSVAMASLRGWIRNVEELEKRFKRNNKGGLDDMLESGFEKALGIYFESHDTMTDKQFNMLKAAYTIEAGDDKEEKEEAGEAEDAEGSEDTDAEGDDGADKDDGDDDKGEDKKLTKKAQAVMDMFDGLSEADKKTVVDLIENMNTNESAIDIEDMTDEQLISVLEDVLPCVKGQTVEDYMIEHGMIEDDENDGAASFDFKDFSFLDN